MPNLKNQDQLAQLKTALGPAKAIILANYSGLSVNDQGKLRADLKEAGAHLQVTKNSLLALAMKETQENVPQELLDALQGPNAVLLIENDPVTPAKALVKFAGEHEDRPAIKLGLLDGKLLSLSDIVALSKLPGKEELLAMLVGQLNAPIAGFAQVLRANLQNLVYALDAIRTKQS